MTPLVDPVDHAPLQEVPGGLQGASGRFYPSVAGGWDLRPPHMAPDSITRDAVTPGPPLDATAAESAAQAAIYDEMLGELTDFDHPHNLTLVHQRDLLDRLDLRAGVTVLELGGHRSGVLPYLEAHAGVVGWGLDISPRWVHAQNVAATQRGSPTRWLLGDAHALPFADRSFAAVVAFDVFEHLADLPRAVGEAFRVLRPGGRLACHLPVQDIHGSLDGLQQRHDPADYAARQASVGHYHERMPTRQKMRVLLEHHGFHVIDMMSFNVWIQPLHDHKLLPALGRLRHRFTRRPPAGEAGGVTVHGASGWQRAYARSVIPVVQALAAPDRLGALLGIGGSCSFLAERPGGAPDPLRSPGS